MYSRNKKILVWSTGTLEGGHRLAVGVLCMLRLEELKMFMGCFFKLEDGSTGGVELLSVSSF